MKKTFSKAELTELLAPVSIEEALENLQIRGDVVKFNVYGEVVEIELSKNAEISRLLKGNGT